MYYHCTGVGLILRELEAAGHANDTLVIYTSDNGIPFPSGRTNLYEPGVREPFIVSSPAHCNSWGQTNSELISHLDIVPTILDWFGIKYPRYSIFNSLSPVQLTGRSLLPLLRGDWSEQLTERGDWSNKRQEQSDWSVQQIEQSDWPNQGAGLRDAVYFSHSLHEVTMYYPSRAIRTAQYKLIHNLNHLMPFSIDQDFYLSPTFRDMLNRTLHGDSLRWYKGTLHNYYYRAEWELYDLYADSQELVNVASDAAYGNAFKELSEQLRAWQNVTSDPWLCSPQAVLEDAGEYKNNPHCLLMLNGL